MAFLNLLLTSVIVSVLVFRVDGVCRKEAIESSPSLFTRKVISEAADITLLQILETTSSVPCELGKSIGFLGTVVWASNGCGAKIDVCFQKGSSVLITCSSNGFRPNKCKVPAGKKALSMIPEKHLSRTPCIYKHNYGFNETIIYVTNGCRAQFRVGVQG